MQIKFLEEIVWDIAGKQATEIVSLLVGEKDVNEFLIAKKMKLTINQTRNILYKLSDFGLVSFIRKKDKRKGWYIYFWTLNVARSLGLLEKKLSEEAEQLERQLKNRKTKRFYFCETCKIEVGEETALLHEFTCSECGQVYGLMENNKLVKELGSRISRLKRDLLIIREEKEKFEEKERKKRRRREPKKKKVKKKVRKKPVKKQKKKEKKKKARKKKIKRKSKSRK